MQDCLFCRIVARDLPAHRVVEDASCVAFLDIHPAARGHTLVVPRVHVPTLWESDPELAAALMRSASVVARLLRDRLRPDGLTLRQNTGAASGQGVFHMHMHLVPRWHGDGNVGWPRRPAEPLDLEEVVRTLRPADA